MQTITHDADNHDAENQLASTLQKTGWQAKAGQRWHQEGHPCRLVMMTGLGGGAPHCPTRIQE
jgi:hypothetical protein